MIPKISGLFLGTALVVMSSCSSLYKSAQTPDDVYYSPGKPVVAAATQSGEGDRSQGEYMETNARRGNRSVENGYGDASYRDDQYLRLMIASGNRSYYYDDLYYNGGFGMMSPWMVNNWRWNSYMTWNMGFGSPYGSLWYWNNFYNPYYSSFYSPYYYNPIYVVPGKGSGYANYVRPSRPSSSFAMGSYLNTNSNGNGNAYRPGRNYQNSFNNSNNRSIYNNSNRRSSGYGNADNNRMNGSSSADRPTRSYSPSTSNSSSSGSRSSGSSGGGGGSISRPTRH